MPLVTVSDTILPVIKTLPETAFFSHTVAPFLPQLKALPEQIFLRINDLNALKLLYISTNPCISALAFALFLSPVVLIVSEVNKNYSQVDRLWSILPVLYNSHYTLWAHLNGLPTERLNHVMAISILWGLRLTFNYWRKGGYSVGSEDYRWEVLREYLSPTLMFIFNVVFISLAQNLLLFSITVPTYILLVASRITGDGLSSYDTIFSRLMFASILIEFFADQQQWDFHRAKAQYQATAKVPPKWSREELDRGFLSSGIWAYSRHPNFAMEQAVWVLLYQWSCCETFTYMNWAFSGAICYLLLFQASTWFTELISSQKYPDYKIYQQRVGKFLPKLNTKSMKGVGVKDETKKAEPFKADPIEAETAKEKKAKGKKR